MSHLTLSSPLRQRAAGAFCALMGSFSALCFVTGQTGYAGMSALPADSASYLWSALALCLWLVYRHAYIRRGLRADALSVGFGLLFGVVNTLGGLLFAYDSWAMLKSPLTLTVTLVRCLGQSLPMMAAFTLADDALRSGRLHGTDAPSTAGHPRLRQWAARHETAACMMLLILCWSPYLIAFFPGTVCWDLGEMVAQFFGQRPMDTWHPVFLTWVMGACVWLGRLLGSDNLGAALYTLLQTLALGYALTDALRFLRERGLRRSVRLCALMFFALCPLWGGYAQFISKDTLYTSVLLLFALSVLRLLCAREGALALPLGARGRGCLCAACLPA